MNFYEKPTNVAAHASSGGERSRWRDDNVDPDLLADPFDVLQAALAAREAKAQAMLVPAAERPLSLDVAAQAMQPTVAFDPSTHGVQRSFGENYAG